jgi:ABC-2 type transport system permease protein
MRTLLVSPFPRWFLLVAKLLAGVTVAIAKSTPFSSSLISGRESAADRLPRHPAGAVSRWADAWGAGAPALLADQEAGEFRRHHELRHLSDVFRVRRALPALARAESSPLLFRICQANPFTYVVELIRFAFYGQIEWTSLAVVVTFTVIFLTGASSPTILRGG